MKLPDILLPFKLPIYLFIGVLLLAVVAWGANSFPRESVLQDLLDKQAKQIEQKYITQMEEKDIEIAGLESKIQASKKIEKGLNDEIKRLRVERGKIYEPKDRKEAIERFNKLGYTPTSK